MADHHQRAGPAVEQVLELGQRLDVQVVGRLVEQQHVGLVHEQPEHLHPAPLAAGQVADPGPLPFRGEAEPLEQLPGGQLTVADPDPQPYLLDRLADPLVRVELGELLGQVGQPHGLAPHHRPVDLEPRPGDVPASSVEQGRLAAAVDPDDPDPVARAELPGHVRPAGAPAAAVRRDRQRDVLQLEDGLAQPGGGQPGQLDAVPGRRLGRDERVGRVDPELRLGASGPGPRAAARRVPCGPGCGGGVRRLPRCARVRPARARRPSSRPRRSAPGRGRPPRSDRRRCPAASGRG